MERQHAVLVLGAYGLAGRAIVERLLRKTSFQVIGGGRDAAKLKAVYAGTEESRLQIRVLDALDASALGAVAGEADLVINAVGPFSRNGAAIARTVLECGRAYVDCANEQRHYRNLEGLHGVAREKGVPLVTAAGAIPGCSTLLAALLLKRFPEADDVACYWAQFRHAYPDSGLASMMGGILEALENPIAMQAGKPVPVVLGKSVKTMELPEPFGRQRLLEVPLIDALTVSAYHPVREFHTWFYMGDLPLWLLDIVRVLQPQRRPWAYRVVESIMRRINTKDTQKAIESGVGPESLLLAEAWREGKRITGKIVFVDGAVATACLPVYLAEQYLSGKVTQTGLLTPLDLVEPGELYSIIEGAALDCDPELFLV